MMSNEMNGMTQERTQHEERQSLISKIFILEQRVKELEDAINNTGCLVLKKVYWEVKEVKG